MSAASRYFLYSLLDFRRAIECLMFEFDGYYNWKSTNFLETIT